MPVLVASIGLSTSGPGNTGARIFSTPAPTSRQEIRPVGLCRAESMRILNEGRRGRGGDGAEVIARFCACKAGGEVGSGALAFQTRPLHGRGERALLYAREPA